MSSFKGIKLSIFLLTTITVCSQTKFEKGYFINSNNERVDCYIKNLRWLYSPEKVNYKFSLEGDELSFGPKDVKEFAVDNELSYVSIRENFPVTEQFTNDKTDKAEPRMVNRHVFVKLLVKGKGTLYQYKESNDEIFLVQLSDKKPIVLEYKQYIPAGTNDIKENNIFRRQLFEKFRCGDDFSIQKVSYNRESLSSYLQEFNICNGESINLKSSTKFKKSKPELRLIVLGGVVGFSFNTTLRTVVGEGFNSRTVNIEPTFETKISPSFGLELESILPFNNRKWSIFLSSQYAKYSATGIVVTNDTSIDAATIDLNQLVFNLGVKHYLFMNDKNSLIILTGMNFDYNLKSDFIESQSFSTGLTSINSTNFGGFVGGGYSFNQSIYLTARYIFGTSINANASEKNNLQRFAISIGIKL